LIDATLPSRLTRDSGSRPELVFVSSENPNVEWDGLDRRYAILTKRYVPGCPGVGPHAIRHIVATSIIIKTGDFLLAADTLHDKPATVEKHYAHLLASVGDRGRRNALGDTYAKVSARNQRGSAPNLSPEKGGFGRPEHIGKG
jgi:hypothetical protein